MLGVKDTILFGILGYRAIGDNASFQALAIRPIPHIRPGLATAETWETEALRALERELIDSPDKAQVIEQTGGLRKLRFTPPGSGRGKSGAYRVCYSYFPIYGTIALFVIFGKNERSDLSPAEARAIAQHVKDIRD